MKSYECLQSLSVLVLILLILILSFNIFNVLLNSIMSYFIQ